MSGGINKANQRQNKTHSARYDYYRKSQRRESNKLKRAIRTIRHQPMNNQLLGCLRNLALSLPVHAKALKVEAVISDIHAKRREMTRPVV